MGTKELKKWMRDNLQRKLGEDYEYLIDYFETLMGDTADYIILISRRCYILYQMFAFIFDWGRKNVISDKGMWCNRSRLNKAERVIIADDIMFSGAAVKRILKKLDIYLGGECIRKIAVFCRCNNCPEMIEENAVKAYNVRPNRDCIKLSNKLVKSIQENGMPYAVFVYPVYGYEKEDGVAFLRDAQRIENNNIFDLGEDEWDSIIYINYVDGIEILKETICEEVCLRVYRKGMQNLVCTIPFAFLRNIKGAFLYKYFKQIQECFEKAGGELISAEIGMALENREVRLESEKFVYLASMLSCCLSRMIGIMYGIEKNMYKEKIESISDRIIRGSFPDEVVNELNDMDKEFVIKFIEELNEHSKVIGECVGGDNDNIYSDSHYKELIEGEKKNKRCGDILVDIFENIRERYNESKEEVTKYISCDEIICLLKVAFSKEEIYAAEIKTWDQGIATYDFYVDELGLRSRCGIGERSQLIFSLKYHSALEMFFQQLPYNSYNYTQEQINSDIDGILSRVDDLSAIEKETFRRTAQNGLVNLYNCFIEI